MSRNAIEYEREGGAPLLYIPIDYYKFEKERHQSME